MYPPHVSDAEVRTLIEALAREGRLPSGSRVRAELQLRFGHRGGVARIYRLLGEVAEQQAGAGQAADPGESIGRELAAAVERARLAEHREQAHQAYWAREVDGLRTRLGEAERLAARAASFEQENRELRRRLASAELRLAAVEARLLAEDGEAT